MAIPPGAQPDYVERFAQEIEAIRLATEATSKLVPESIANLSQQLARTFDVYENAGPSRGTPGERAPSGKSSTSSLSDSIITYAGTGWDGARSGQSSLDDVTQTAASVRQELAQTQPRRRPRAPGVDTDEEDAEGQSGLPTGSTWRDRVQEGGIGDVIPLPRYGGAKPTPRDYLQYLSTISANVAQKRQNVLDQRAKDTQSDIIQQAAMDGLIDLDENGEITGDVPQSLQNKLDAAQAPDTKLGKVSDLFAAGESAYAHGKYVKGIIQSITEPASAMRQYGYQTGFEGGNPGLLGIRSPFDSAAQAGFGQRASEFGFALNNNVTPAQAGSIYNNLFEQGWYGGGSTNNLRSAAAQMMQQNPYIASMSQYYEMMDKATRQGAVSLSTFNQAMMQIPNVSKAAHTSIVDTMSAMDALGQYNKSTGGTYMGGLQNAIDWQNVTGMPAPIMQQLMQNPLVVGQTFAATGLMPQMQGLASPFQHTQGILGALNLMNKAILAPANRSYKDPITGLSQTISGQDQKEALLAQQLGVSKEVVHNMLSNQKGWMAGMEVTNSAETYSGAVTADLRRGDTMQARYDLNNAPWQKLREAIGKATDSQGHKVFEDWGTYSELEKANRESAKYGGHTLSEARLHQLSRKQAMYNIDTAGDTKALQDLGFSKDLISQMGTAKAHQTVETIVKSGHGTKQMLSDIARARAQEIKHYQNMNTQKFGTGNQGNNGPQLQIELGPAAKKMFHLNDPNTQQKAAMNAGSASVNLNSWVTGPTSAPYPDLSTAGGTSTYNYGGPNDTGTP